MKIRASKNYKNYLLENKYNKIITVNKFNSRVFIKVYY